MKFLSTRNKTEKKTFSEAILLGISKEGGLFVPEAFPLLTSADIIKFADMDYQLRAAYILEKFSCPAVEKITEAYSGQFDEDDPAPLLKIDNGLFMLELFHGTTLAFKDLALRLLPRMVAAAKAETGEDKHTLILTATSGDTGKAALDAFSGIEGTSIIALYPADGVSKMQELQMVTQTGGNVSAVGIRGNFDDCQRAVKEAMGDRALVDELAQYHTAFGSANSINIGRLLPQIVYYFSAYADMLAAGEIEIGDRINFAVPTGNFGNILAGFYAKKMGLPVNKLICASNENNVLTDFFSTGEYSTKRDFIKTISPSMDILVSSNLERLLYELFDRDDARVSMLMQQLKAEGVYKITEAERKRAEEHFFAWYADEKTTKDTIQSFFEEYDYLLDPHTAIAVAASDKYRRMTLDETPTVVVSTAHPYKFAPDVYEAVMEVSEPDPFRAAEELYDISAIEIPQAIAELKNKKRLHKQVIDKGQLKDTIVSFVRQMTKKEEK